MSRFAQPVLCAVLSLTVCGCGDKSSYIVVNLHSGAPLSLTAISVDLENAGATSTVRIDKAVNLPPDESFSLQFGRERSGDVHLTVHGLQGTNEFATATATVTLDPGNTVDTTVALTPDTPDMGQPDMGQPDMGPPQPVFAAPTLYSAQPFPYSVTLADMNGDKRLDVVVANSGQATFRADCTGESVSVLLGNGDGTFQTAHSFAFGPGPTSVITADFDRDGKLDVATADGCVGSGGFLAVGFGNGDGTLAVPLQLPASQRAPTALATAAMDKDSYPDIVSVLDDCEVDVYLASGARQFAAPRQNTSHSVNVKCNTIAVGDIDRDGNVDVVVSGSMVGVLLGVGDGTLRDMFVLGNLVEGPAELADVDGDGILDCVANTLIAMGDELRVLRGAGDGTFQAPQTFVAPRGLVSFALGDLNHDTALDVVLAGTSDTSAMMGRGNGSFQSPMVILDSAAWGIALGDLNDDGRLDVVTASNTMNNGIVVLLNRTQ